MDLGIPPARIKNLLESKPWNSGFLVCGLAAKWEPQAEVPEKPSAHYAASSAPVLFLYHSASSALCTRWSEYPFSAASVDLARLPGDDSCTRLSILVGALLVGEALEFRI